MRWGLLLKDGSLLRGAGPLTELTPLLRDVLGGVFVVPASVPLYVVGGISVLYTVTCQLGGSSERAWGLGSSATTRLWLVPGQEWMGLGPSLDAVERVVRGIRQAVRSQRALPHPA